MSYAASLSSRSSDTRGAFLPAQPSVRRVISKDSNTAVDISNRFSPLKEMQKRQYGLADSLDACNSEAKSVTVAEVHVPNIPRRHSNKLVQKRHYSSTDSLDVRPSKFPTSKVDRPGSNDRSVMQLLRALLTLLKTCL